VLPTMLTWMTMYGVGRSQIVIGNLFPLRCCCRGVGQCYRTTSRAPIGIAVGPVVGISVGAALGWATANLTYYAAGGEDDVVAHNTLSLDYDELLEWSTQSKYRIMDLGFDGGDEGKYILRSHIEFAPEFRYDFEHEFTRRDEFATGNVYDLTSEDEIVVVVDQDASGNDDRFYILRGASGDLLANFDRFFSRWDRVAIGDVFGAG
jgi:hypothetical protein